MTTVGGEGTRLATNSFSLVFTITSLIIIFFVEVASENSHYVRDIKRLWFYL